MTVFYLVVYKLGNYDITSHTKDTVLNESIAIQRRIWVKITNCIVPALSWPNNQLKIELNQMIGS